MICGRLCILSISCLFWDFCAAAYIHLCIFHGGRHQKASVASWPEGITTIAGWFIPCGSNSPSSDPKCPPLIFIVLCVVVLRAANSHNTIVCCETLGPGTHMDITLTHTTHLSLSVEQIHPLATPPPPAQQDNLPICTMSNIQERVTEHDPNPLVQTWQNREWSRGQWCGTLRGSQTRFPPEVVGIVVQNLITSVMRPSINFFYFWPLPAFAAAVLAPVPV